MSPRFLAIAIVVFIAGCSGGSGTDVEILPNLDQGGADRSLVLNGPPPATDDVQRFRVHVWENVAAENRCGECHGAGGQSPTFARNDDINLAYDAANTIVDLGQPVFSRMVTKVGEGHNCWLSSEDACADILTTWIGNWAGDAAGASTTITLTPPAEREPGASKSFPEDASGFAATVHPLLTTYCAACHTDSAAVPQSPFFAVADAEAAYAAARSRIEIDDPASSRLVVRLGAEFHNCWDDCSANAAEMLSAIEAFVADIPETMVDPALVTSRALTLADGVVASGGGRQDGSAIALYEFKTMTGTTAFDTSGVAPAMDLTFAGDVSWVGGWGLRFGDGARAQASTSSSTKLFDLINSTGEYSIEAWALPANVTQEEARIVSYSGSTTAANFMLGQTLYNYDFLARSTATDAAGNPALSTPDADEVLQAALQHVVATFDPVEGRQLYVNGERIDIVDDAPGAIADWDDTFAFVLGNEVSGDRQWLGVLRLVAVHNRALTATQVLQNFEAGVGEQFFLLFGVSHLIDVPDAYFVFEVSQFDSYSYLFANPFFISLDGNASPDAVPVAGIRIGINGREPEVGQAYSRLSLSLGEGYVSGEGQVLSPVGTILGIEKGPEADEFFLTFERLGDHENVRVEGPVQQLQLELAATDAPDVGIRLFDEVNATLSAVTTVPMSAPDVRATYEQVRQALPSSPDIEGFLSSQQMGITQLAIEYCNVLVEDETRRQALFPTFDFNAGVATAFADRTALLGPLLTRTLGDGVATAPDRVDAEVELNALIDRLAAGGGDAARTRTISKATCAAVLGSAAILIQ